MTTPVPIESSAITGFMASAQRLFNRRGSSDSTSSEDGVKVSQISPKIKIGRCAIFFLFQSFLFYFQGNVNFNINAPEFIPKWKLPTSVNPDTDLTGFSPKEEKHLETEKEPDLEKSIKKKVKKKSNCEYCKKKGQRISIYTSHQMQDSNTEEILCPMLKKTL